MWGPGHTTQSHNEPRCVYRGVCAKEFQFVYNSNIVATTTRVRSTAQIMGLGAACFLSL